MINWCSRVVPQLVLPGLVADFGCGNGWLAHSLYKTHKVHCYDIPSETWRYAKYRYAKVPSVTLKSIGLKDSSPLKRSYPTIIAIGTLNRINSCIGDSWEVFNYLFKRCNRLICQWEVSTVHQNDWVSDGWLMAHPESVAEEVGCKLTIVDNGPRWRLFIFGDPPSRSVLKRLKRRKSSSSKVKPLFHRKS